MTASAEGKAKRKRKSHIPAGPAGARLAMDPFGGSDNLFLTANRDKRDRPGSL